MFAVMVIAGGTWACGESQPEVELPETAELGVIELGRIGGRIYNEPERAREILEAAGLTPEQFEERVRAITNDPALATEYTRGFETVLRPRPQVPGAVARDTQFEGPPVGTPDGPPEGRREGLPVDSIGRPLPPRPQGRREGPPEGRRESLPVDSIGRPPPPRPQGRREGPPVGRRESLPVDSIGRPLPYPPE
jgi:hypothetical protein